MRRSVDRRERPVRVSAGYASIFYGGVFGAGKTVLASGWRSNRVALVVPLILQRRQAHAILDAAIECGDGSRQISAGDIGRRGKEMQAVSRSARKALDEGEQHRGARALGEARQ